MPAVHLNHVSYRYTSAVDVLNSVDLHLGPGWSGIVGANGSGKTTLLRLIAGHLAPTGGRVVVDPENALVVLCGQTVEELSADIDDFSGSWEGNDVVLRGRLELSVEQLSRWPTLSPGERKRWQIGAALSRQPDVLLLDEPTNHLDFEGRRMLLDSLHRFGGVGLVVSHDRGLLEELTIRTLRVDRGEATLWNGAYRVASQGWKAVEAERRAEHERLRAETKRAKSRLVELRQTAERKTAAFKRKNNSTSFKDIDARSAARGSKHADGEKAAFAALATAAKASERAAGAASAIEASRNFGREIFIDFAPAPRRILASHLGPLSVGGEVLVDHVDVAVGRTDRIRISGRNGAGKTTLLKTLVANAQLPEDKFLFLEQEMTSSQVSDVMAKLRTMGPKELGRTMALVAALGVAPEVLLASEEPSSGEARKLAMALGLGRASWLVVLDEPTNHLDLPSIERLQAALASYPGALVVVSHDDEFANDLNLRDINVRVKGMPGPSLRG